MSKKNNNTAITKPVLLDDTGKEIVTKLEEIKNKISGGGGGGEPAEYLKRVEVNGNKASFINKDDTPTEFEVNVPTKTSQLTNDSGFLTEHQSLAAYRKSIDQDTIDKGLGDRLDAIEGKEAGWNAKQDAITDLNKIRSGAAKGDTAVQPSALDAYRKAADQDIIDNAAKGRLDTIEGKEAGWDAKQEKVIAGPGITIGPDGKTISATGISIQLKTINNEHLEGTGNIELVKPTDLANVATSGSYNDLIDKPSIPEAIQFDGKTLIKGADGKYKTAIGGWLELGSLIFQGEGTSDGTVEKLVLSNSLLKSLAAVSDIPTIIISPAGTAEERYGIVKPESGGDYFLNINDKLEGCIISVGHGNIGDEVTIINTKGTLAAGEYSVIFRDVTEIYHPLDNKFLKLDPMTMSVNDAGELTAQLRLDAGDGIKIVNNRISTNFGGDIKYIPGEVQWDNKNFRTIYNDVYGLVDGPTGTIFENGHFYKLTSTMFEETVEEVYKATNLNIQIQGASYETVGIHLGDIQGMDAFIINYNHEGVIEPALVVEGSTTEIQFGTADISSLAEVELEIKFINNRVLDINESGLEIDADEKLNVIPYTAGEGISINNHVISSTGRGEPEEYIKKVEIEGNNITFTNKDNVTTEYNPSIPTKTSELENDSGFLTEHQSLADYAKTVDVNTAIAAEAELRDTADSELQNKIDAEELARQNADAGKIDLLGNAPDGGPYRLSYFYKIEPDADKIIVIAETISLDNNKTKKAYQLTVPAANVSTAGLMSNVDKQKLENAITKAVDNLEHYYKKDETYTQEEVNELIAAIKTLEIVVVDTLPTTGEEGILYLKKLHDTELGDYCEEYLWIENRYEKIGDTTISLKEYRKAVEQDVIDNNKINLLGNEAVSGQPYHFPYNIDASIDGSKLKIKWNTITLDNNKTLQPYEKELELPGIDESKLANKVETTIEGAEHEIYEALYNKNGVLINKSKNSAHPIYSTYAKCKVEGNNLVFSDIKGSIKDQIPLSTLAADKADKPGELPPELKVPGVDYPWFMINLDPKGVDAEGNFKFEHSGYNFNTKEYYTWKDKSIPMAASQTAGGFMTAADKTKLDDIVNVLCKNPDFITALAAKLVAEGAENALAVKIKEIEEAVEWKE